MLDTSTSLERLIASGLQSESFSTLMRAGGGILLLGFLLNLLLEWVKFYQGERPNWAGPIFGVLVTSLALAIYPFIIQIVVSWVGIFGDLEDASKQASAVFSGRMERFIGALENVKEDASLLEIFTGINELKASILWALTLLLKYVTLALIMSLKVIQGLILRTLVFIGPVFLSLGILPGPFKRLPMNWFVLFFTISFWSVVMNSLLKMLANSTQNIVLGEVNLSEEIIISFVWIFLIISVPALSSALIYGSGFSGVFSEATSSATSTMKSAASKMVKGS